MKKILIIFGTRPEAIKMIPVIQALKSHKCFNVEVCVTAQHRQMLDQVLSLFHVIPDYDLNIMQEDQDLYDITSRIITGLKTVMQTSKPDLVLVHGDTTTTSMAALSALYQKIPVGHVEAGLRSGDIYSPWPEEANRRIVGVLAEYHFAPTTQSKTNLLRENIPKSHIIVTGNTVIDTLFLMLKRIESSKDIREQIEVQIIRYYPLKKERRFILVTGHRRENFGEGFIHICHAIKTLAQKNPDVDIVYPVHLNPNVRKPVMEILGGIKNIFLLKPKPYEVFVYLMSKAYFILTDSGGIQEEAPALGKPVLLMRDTTERPEAVAAGTVKLVGSKEENIVSAAQTLLDDVTYYRTMSQAHNPYGDGRAAERILRFIEKNL